jgi:hypothetical protein
MRYFDLLAEKVSPVDGDKTLTDQERRQILRNYLALNEMTEITLEDSADARTKSVTVLKEAKQL